LGSASSALAQGPDDYRDLLKQLEKVPSPHCGLTTPMGNECSKAISKREPNNEADCESDFEARRHDPATPAMRLGFRRSGGCDRSDSPPASELVGNAETMLARSAVSSASERDLIAATSHNS
jgi:hypothetical protein